MGKKRMECRSLEGQECGDAWRNLVGGISTKEKVRLVEWSICPSIPRVLGSSTVGKVLSLIVALRRRFERLECGYDS